MTDTTYDFENLVCEGGGVKGTAVPGTLIALHKLGILKNFKRYAGSSIGALFCSLLAMNVSVEAIVYLNLTIDYTLMQSKSCLLTKAFRAYNRFGLAENERITNIVRKSYEIVGVDPSTTFGQNFRRTGKELYVSGTNLNTNMVFFFSHHTHPEMTILEAVALSMCIPGYYVPFKIGDDYWIDGGMAENYPIYVFNDLDILKTGYVYDINRDPICPKTLGIKLLTPSEKHTRRVFYGRQEFDSVCGMMASLLNTMERQIEMSDISDSYLAQTIPISDLDIQVFDLELSTDKRKEAMKKGEKAAMEYFKNYHPSLDQCHIKNYPRLTAMLSPSRSSSLRELKPPEEPDIKT